MVQSVLTKKMQVYRLVSLAFAVSRGRGLACPVRLRTFAKEPRQIWLSLRHSKLALKRPVIFCFASKSLTRSIILSTSWLLRPSVGSSSRTQAIARFTSSFSIVLVLSKSNTEKATAVQEIAPWFC